MKNILSARPLLLVLTTGITLSCAGESSRQAEPDTVRPQRGEFRETLRWFGTVESRNTVRVTAPRRTRIASVEMADGAHVEKGEVLFRLDDPVIKARRDALSEEPGEEAANEKAVLSEALQLRASSAGVLARRRVSAGQMVRPGDPLVEIVPLDQLGIRATLFPKNNADLTHRAARIRAASGETLQGTVAQVLPERSPDGATVIWIESDTPLHPGETASGTVLGPPHSGALSLPASSLMRDEQEQAWVLIKKKDGIHRQSVQPGLRSGNRVEIRSGLSTNDEIVVKGAYELFHQDFNKTYKVVD